VSQTRMDDTPNSSRMTRLTRSPPDVYWNVLCTSRDVDVPPDAKAHTVSVQGIRVGRSLCSCVPSPSWPAMLCPQAHSVPSALMARV